MGHLMRLYGGGIWKRLKGAITKFVRFISDSVVPLIQVVSVAISPVLPGVATAMGLVATVAQKIIKGVVTGNAASNSALLGSYQGASGDKFELTY